MARKSRKAGLQKTPAAGEAGQKIYRTAVYVRLSVENERKIESESVENQIEFLKSYVAGKPDLVLKNVYADRGVTGTRFDRPAFNQMIASMKAGEIDCIVVKDLSRLGRNYLEAGDYIEKIFPFFRIRFIAVTDHYDSLTSKPAEDGLVVPLKNLINEAYAKDISRKICSANESMYRAGIKVGSHVPYGYLRDPEKKHQIVVDESVRDVVVRIFREYTEGTSTCQIARELNKEGIASPGQHYIDIGYCKSKRGEGAPWESRSVCCILRNVNYTGTLEMGSKRSAYYKGYKDKIQPPEKRYYVENHHEALVDQETFRRANEMLEASHRKFVERRTFDASEKNQRPAILAGVLYCADCKRHMSLYRRTIEMNGKIYCYSTYVCRRSATAAFDKPKHFKADEIENAIAELIRQHISLFMDAADRMKAANRRPEAIDRKKAIEKRISEEEKRKRKIGEVLQNLYADFSDDLFSEKEYLEMKQSYIVELEETGERLESLSAELARYQEEYEGNPDATKTFHRFEGFETLTEEIVKTFIRRIECSADGKMEVSYTFGNDIEKLLQEAAKREGERA